MRGFTPSLLRRPGTPDRSHKSFIQHRPLASTRLFSNILIYAAFAGLIWRLLSFICAFRGEICPSDMLLRGLLRGRKSGRESRFPECCNHNAEEIEDRFRTRHCVYAACVFFFFFFVRRPRIAKEKGRRELRNRRQRQWGYQNIFPPQASLLREAGMDVSSVSIMLHGPALPLNALYFG